MSACVSIKLPKDLCHIYFISQQLQIKVYKLHQRENIINNIKVKSSSSAIENMHYIV